MERNAFLCIGQAILLPCLDENLLKKSRSTLINSPVDMAQGSRDSQRSISPEYTDKIDACTHFDQARKTILTHSCVEDEMLPPNKSIE